ncbi:hypothetical protein [Sphingobacterium gobiense]|uniref:Uncharacterized protein n=1 Tax=Sphingobacterium gobiense TaxID=1382456 RepID=A0A2S9JI99_9SPHI|nr:hypothetical protein [Sphingobacterium gobiense]PRD52721.1 hypothetical protein C5749_15995 [Sphingobacterium gobiense]
MRYYWDLIRHFFIANSRHGTHSPFVYDLAVNAVYAVSSVYTHHVNVPLGLKPRYKKLLLRILERMEKKEVAYFQKATDADVLWVDLKETSMPVPNIIEAVRQGKVIIVHEPFQTIKTKRLWQQLVQSKDVVVSINLFHFGLLMYRKEQQKENFRLRYPFWR